MAEDDLNLNEFEDDGKGGEAPQPEPEESNNNPESVGEAMTEYGDLPRSAKDLEAVYDIPVKVSDLPPMTGPF